MTADTICFKDRLNISAEVDGGSAHPHRNDEDANTAKNGIFGAQGMMYPTYDKRFLKSASNA